MGWVVQEQRTAAKFFLSPQLQLKEAPKQTTVKSLVFPIDTKHQFLPHRGTEPGKHAMRRQGAAALFCLLWQLQSLQCYFQEMESLKAGFSGGFNQAAVFCQDRWCWGHWTVWISCRKELEYFFLRDKHFPVGTQGSDPGAVKWKFCLSPRAEPSQMCLMVLWASKQQRRWDSIIRSGCHSPSQLSVHSGNMRVSLIYRTHTELENPDLLMRGK